MRILRFGRSFNSSFTCTSNLSSDSHESSSVRDHNERRKLEVWLEHCKYNGITVPENIEEEDFKHLMTLSSYQKLKFIEYLGGKKQKKSEDIARKEKLKELKKKEREERTKLQPDHIKYGLWQNSMMIKITKPIFKNIYYHRWVSAVIHNQPTIVDLSFTNLMNRHESRSAADQLLFSIVRNEEDVSPLNLTFCNVDLKSETMIHLKKIMPTIETIPMNIVSQNYLNLYPKEKLVYLTPNAKNEMSKFDPEAIYIIGGIVERGAIQPVTLSKAKKEGIKVQKLPLDRYHIFKHHKSLDIHIVIAILLDVQNTGDWKKSLENIPSKVLQTATDRHNEFTMKRNRNGRRQRLKDFNNCYV